jgi:hypothetical protein
MQSSEVVTVLPNRLYLSDANLDYALVAVAPKPGLEAYGWLPLIADLGKLLVGEKVTFIQHPNGEPKQLAIRDNQVVDELELFLHYQTDTDPGSSGSPVLNDQWEVVALHHSGVPKRNSKGEVLPPDGRAWEEGMGEQRIAWEANEGVLVSRLVQHIREQPLPPEAEELRQELLEAAPPPLATAAESPPRSPVTVQPQAVQEPAGISTWTIPLQVSMSLGLPMQHTQAATPTPQQGSTPEAQERWLIFGHKPPLPPPPPPAPPVTTADFRLASLTKTSFDWSTSLSLCLASELAYKGAAEVKRQALAWGFSGCEFVEKKAAQGFGLEQGGGHGDLPRHRERVRLDEQSQCHHPHHRWGGPSSCGFSQPVPGPAARAGTAASRALQPAPAGSASRWGKHPTWPGVQPIGSVFEARI